MTDQDKAPLLLLLSQWKRELADAQRVVDERKIAIFHLEQTLSGGAVPAGATLRKSRATAPKPPRPPGLTAHTRAAIRDADGPEVSIPTIYDAMVAKGVKFSSKHPKLRMAKVFDRLIELGALEKTFKGSGYTPNRYRKTARFNEIVAADSSTEEQDDA